MLPNIIFLFNKITLRANNISIADPPSSKSQPNAAQSFTKWSSLNVGSSTPSPNIINNTVVRMKT